MPIYMKYEGVSGEVNEKSHKGWVELRFLEFRAPVSKATLIKQRDTASPQFYREWKWRRGKNVTFDFAHDDGTVYWKVEMKGTLISDISPASVDSDIETLTLNFTKIAVTQPAPLKDQKHAAQLIEFRRIQQRMS